MNFNKIVRIAYERGIGSFVFPGYFGDMKGKQNRQFPFVQRPYISARYDDN